jgi:hypothetical protein
MPPPSIPARKMRDARIDLARGLTMLIIFVAHVPGNLWAQFIPARMGFSSGAEAFVLCSGLACGLAFGGTFRRDGFMAGARRIGRRIGQLWLAQVLTFAAFAVLLLAIDRWLGGAVLRSRYALDYVVAAPSEAMLALATLRYVPDYFDILPLYILLLAATPLMVVLAGLSRFLALGLSAALWLAVQLLPLNLSAHPVGDKLWFFDPFAWQFLFFIGFGVTARWFTPPAPTRPLVLFAAALIVGSIPLTFWLAHEIWPVLGEINRWIYPNDAIATLHPFRLLHVLVLAWLFAALLSARRETIGDGVLRPVVVVGQQSLITFLAGVFLSALAGVALDVVGRAPFETALVNIAGCAALIAIAYAARAVKAGRAAPMRAVTQRAASPAA